MNELPQEFASFQFALFLSWRYPARRSFHDGADGGARARAARLARPTGGTRGDARDGTGHRVAPSSFGRHSRARRPGFYRAPTFRRSSRASLRTGTRRAVLLRRDRRRGRRRRIEHKRESRRLEILPGRQGSGGGDRGRRDARRRRRDSNGRPSESWRWTPRHPAGGHRPLPTASRRPPRSPPSATSGRPGGTRTARGGAGTCRRLSIPNRPRRSSSPSRP